MTNTLLQTALKNRKRAHKKQQGFTLIELLIVIVIIGTLSGIALPNFIAQRNKAKVAKANSAAVALISACEIAITNDKDVTEDDDVTRLDDLLPDDADATATSTLESPDTCSVEVTGDQVETDGNFVAFNEKTSAIAK